MNRLSLFLIAMVLIFQTTNTKASDNHLDVGYLGISSEKVSKEKAKALGFDNPYGSYVTRIWPNTPAEKVNLQIFDYIYGIDDQRTERYKDLDDLLKFKEPGDIITLHFIRKNKKESVRVKLDQRSNTFYFNSSDDQKPFLGVTDNCGCPEHEIGIKVGIVYNSTAQEMGLKDDDIITAINNYPIFDWADVTTAINGLRPGQKISVTYKRNGRTSTVSANIKSYKATKEFEKQVRTHAPPAFLGVFSSQLSKEKARKLGFDNAYGSYITRVIPQSAAEKHGIRPFDYIYGIDEYRVGEHQSLTHILTKYRSGETARLYFIRKGREMTQQVVFGARSDTSQPDRPRDKCEDPFLGVRNDYRTFSEKGVSVTIVGNSTAEEMGMKNGDVITHINEYMIIDWADISVAVDNLEVGDPIEVIYLRNGQQLQSSRPIKSECETTLSDSQRIRLRTTPEPDQHIIIKGEGDNKGVIYIRLTEPTGRELSNLALESRMKLSMNNNLEVEELEIHTTKEDDGILLSFKIPEKGNTQVRIFSHGGRSIYNYELDSFSGAFKDELDIAKNGSGVYFLHIQQGKASLTKKIILQKQ